MENIGAQEIFLMHMSKIQYFGSKHMYPTVR